MKKISRHKRLIIFLLAFFLGGFGVHRFWGGKNWNRNFMVLYIWPIWLWNYI